MPNRFRLSPLAIAGWIVLAIAVVYIVAWPLAERIAHSWATSQSLMRIAPAPLGQRMVIRLFEFSVYAWIFFFGASVGSFLNVVIYRLPRGRTLLGTSHCPYCCAAIRPRDNVPVFGWLALRGRCRKCRLPISPRYPIVEFITGAILLTLAWAELLGGQENVSWLIRHPDWDGVVRCLYHFVLMCVLLSWTYIRYDGHPLPPMYIAVAIFAGFAIAAVWPEVHVRRDDIFGRERLQYLLDAGPIARELIFRFTTSAIGVGFGLIVGMLWQLGTGRGRRPGSDVRAVPEGLAIWCTIGVYVGWQPLLAIALLTGSLWIVAAWTSLWIGKLRPIPPLAWATIAALVNFCLADWLEPLFALRT